MIALVIGGASSGKSAIAENLAVNLSTEKLYYIATMQVHDCEDLSRVNKHRNMRAGKGFVTIERSRNLSSVPLPEHATVLLECMSNLVANEMYDEPQAIQDIPAMIVKQIHSLAQCCDNLIIVSNEVFSDGTIYNESCMEYINNLGQINSEIANFADVVIEAVVGIPLYRKGVGTCIS